MPDNRAAQWSYADWASPAELPAEPMETYESWVVRNMVSGLVAVRESLAARRIPSNIDDAPPIPPTVTDPTGAVKEAWRQFYSQPRRSPSQGSRTPLTRRPGRRPMHQIVGDPDLRHLEP